MRTIACLVTTFFVAAPSITAKELPPAPLTEHEATEYYQQWVEALASSEMEGRGVGTIGLHRAETAIAEEFLSLDLHPVFSNNFLVPINVITGTRVLTAEVSLSAESLTLNQNYAVVPLSGSGSFSGSIVDVGFGIVEPSLGLDDYANQEVSGNIALVRRFLPKGEWTPNDEARLSDLAFKAFLAEQYGAIAVVFWSEDPAADSLQIPASPRFSSKIPVIVVRHDLGQKMAGELLAGTISVEQTTARPNNVVGKLHPECRAKGSLVVGAHLDHLGFGGPGSLDPAHAGEVHPGADDNASGVAAMLTAARQLRQRVPVNPTDPCIIFVAFTAEEMGLIGSQALMGRFRQAGIELAALVNLDMVGRVENNRIIVIGSKSSPTWADILPQACQSSNLLCDTAAEGAGLGRSDHVSFLINKVPSIHLFSGVHEDYHRASDTPDKINAQGGARVALLTAYLIEHLRNKDIPFEPVPLPPTGGDRTGRKIFLGTVPDFGSEPMPSGVKGARLAGVVPGSPAHRVGIQAGDIVVSLNGKPTDTLESYAFLLRAIQPGDEVVLGIHRDGAVSHVALVAETRGQ